MRRKEPSEHRKIKNCVIAIWGHLLFVTWIILHSKMALYIQVSALTLLFISMYLQLVLIQDYLYLKKHTKNEDLRRDIRVIEPLLPERHKKNDTQT